VRDIIVVSVILGLVPVSLKRPWLGVLAWYWIAYFVPHGLAWGFAKTFPVAMLIGGATLLGFLFAKDRKPLPKNWATYFMLALTIQFTLTTVFAHNPALAWGKWDRVMKILLMTFVTMSLFQDRTRLRWLYMVPALGLGFYGIKGALWVLRTGGGPGGVEGAADGQRIFGPDGSFFADANSIGPALCMILPILLYLSREEKRPWLKRIFQVGFGLSIVSVIFTFSRGAFLGLAVVVFVLIWRSPWRMRFATGALVIGLLAAPLAPDRLWERIGSITKQESVETRDMSTVGRLQSFETAWNIALGRPFTGGGFMALSSEDLWAIYFGPNYYKAFDAHSIYFEVLGEHGLLGFALYMGALLSTLVTLRRLRKRWRNHPEHGYLSRYAEMTQLSLYPFLVCGAFVPFAYFDLYFLLLATSSMLFVLSQEAERVEVPAPVPQQRRSPAIAVRQNALPSRTRRRPRHV
jgi:probable O-glycosylation ligase (exosortase A-associated)